MTGENAALLEINTAGTPDAYGDVTTKGTSEWAGRVPAHLKRVRRRVVSGGTVTPVEMDVLVVLRSHGVAAPSPPGDQQAADTLLVEDQRGPAPVTRRFRVVGVEDRAAGTDVDSWRAELADERAS